MTTKQIDFNIHDVINKYVNRETLDRYYVELMAINQSVNLVSRETSRSDFDRLCADSLLPLSSLPEGSTNYLDIGSGGGLPAIPICLSGRINGEIDLIERTKKKAVALERIASTLSIHCRVIPQTFEETRPKGLFGLVTLRYVKLDRPLLKKITQLLSPTGAFVYYSSTELVSKSLDKEPCSYDCPDQGIPKHFTVFRTK